MWSAPATSSSTSTTSATAGSTTSRSPRSPRSPRRRLRAAPRGPARARLKTGGPSGYADLLDILADPGHEEHEDRLAWLGGPLEPEQFSVPASGRDLRRDIAALVAAGEEDPPDVDHSFFDLSRPLVAAVMAMPPHQRASLAAVIAGSLATEIEDAMLLLDQHRAAAAAPKAPRAPGRTRKPKS